MAPQVAHPFAPQIYFKHSSAFLTYDHRTLKIELPVRSAVLKQCTGGLVVRWVTTGEYPLLYVFCSFLLPCDDGCRDGFFYCTVRGKGKGYVRRNVIKVPKGWDMSRHRITLSFTVHPTPHFPSPVHPSSLHASAAHGLGAVSCIPLLGSARPLFFFLIE
jgi:hypothetical protein